MRLQELRLNHFGKFHNTTIQLKSGVNLIYGDNEAGKTTIHAFIKGMLFGIERLRGRASKEDPYLRYQPWDVPGAYSGSMDIEVEGKSYRIIRNFHKNTKSFQVVEIETGREVEIHPEHLKDLYGGLTEAGFRNTISMEQLKTATDQDLALEVRNYITNLSLSKSDEVNITSALSFLQNKTKELENKITNLKIDELEKEIAYGISCEERIDRLSKDLELINEQEGSLLNSKNSDDVFPKELEGFITLDEFKEYVEQFPAIKEKYKNYLELQNQVVEEENTIADFEFRKNGAKEAQAMVTLMKNQLGEIDTYKNQISILEEKQKQQMESQYVLEKNKQRTGFLLVGILGVLSAFLLLVTGFQTVGFLSTAGVTSAGILFYSLLIKKLNIKIKAIKKNNEDNEVVLKEQKQALQAIYMEHKVDRESDLRNKYDTILRSSIQMEQVQREIDFKTEQLNMLHNKINKLQNELLDYFRLFTNIVLSISSERNPLSDVFLQAVEDFINSWKSNLVTDQLEKQKAMEEINIQKEKIKWELERLEEQEIRLINNRVLYKEHLQVRQDATIELEAIKLAADTLRKLSTEIHYDFGNKLNQLVSKLSTQVTSGKYNNIKIDEKLDVKVGHNADYLRLESLSAGTINQIYFALRLGVADLIYGKNNMPILLDDCFAYYDDIRVKAALRSLVQKDNTQIIIFTCHHREKAILDEMGESYNYIDLNTCQKPSITGV